MEPRLVPIISRHVVRLLSQMLTLIVCLALINYAYFEQVLLDVRATQDFTMTACRVLHKEVLHKSYMFERYHLADWYKAEFLLAYSVNNVPYQAAASGNGLSHAYTSDKLSQQLLAEKYAVNKSYVCWYDPRQPARLVLIPRYDWSAYWPLLVPLVIAGMMLYGLMNEMKKIWIGWKSFSSKDIG